MNLFQKGLLMLFHPLDCFDIIKREKRLRLWPVFLLYTLAFLVNYLHVFAVHFSLSAKSAVDASLWLEAAVVVAPLFSWVVASYAMTAILSGESHFVQLLTASAYALTPYVLLKPLLSGLSHLLGGGFGALYTFLETALLLWVLLLLFAALKHMNDYRFFQALGVAALSLAAMTVLWAVVLVLFSLTVQLFTVLGDVMREIRFKF